MKKYILTVFFMLVGIVGYALANTSGNCGKTASDNLTWSYNVSTKTLTIAGSGAMADYKNTASSSTNNPAPWGVYKGDIQVVHISGEVSSIGNYAFYQCSSLASVTIGNSVTSIGVNAFYQCSSLASVTIPNSVKSIGDNAFSSCSSLTNMAIPNTVENTGVSIISGCSSLTSVTLPDNMTSIGTGFFSGCTSLTSITIPNSVTSIGTSAFAYCTALETVTLEEGIKANIGVQAFSYCTAIKQLRIPASMKGATIGSLAFTNTNISTLTDCSEHFYHDGAVDVSACHNAGIYPDTQNTVVLGCENASNATTNYPFIVHAGEYPLFIDEGQTLEFSHLILRAIDEDKPIVIVPQDGNILIAEAHDLWYEWKVKVGKNYFVSLPCDVDWANIDYRVSTNADGTHEWDGNFMMNFYTYEGGDRAMYGRGEDRDHWTRITDTTAPLQRGVGYAFNVEPVAGHAVGEDIVIRFPINMSIFNDVEHAELPWENVQIAENRATPNNTTIFAEDGGWNLIGNPYLTEFKAENLKFANGNPLTGYVSMYTTIGGERYIQTPLENAVIPPMTSFFVQVNESGEVNFDVNDRVLEYPVHHEFPDPTIPPVNEEDNDNGEPAGAPSSRNFAPLRLGVWQEYTRIGLTLDGDVMGLVIGDDFTADYEINADLVKMFGSTQRTAVYSVYGSKRLAYLALPADLMSRISVGYSLTAGEHRFKTSPVPSQGGEIANAIEHLYLVDKLLNITTDLLASDYTFTTTADEQYNEGRFEISAVMGAPETVTSIAEGAEVQSPQKLMRDGQMYIRVNGVVYNALGQIVK